MFATLAFSVHVVMPRDVTAQSKYDCTTEGHHKIEARTADHIEACSVNRYNNQGYKGSRFQLFLGRKTSLYEPSFLEVRIQLLHSSRQENRNTTQR